MNAPFVKKSSPKISPKKTNLFFVFERIRKKEAKIKSPVKASKFPLRTRQINTLLNAIVAKPETAGTNPNFLFV